MNTSPQTRKLFGRPSALSFVALSLFGCSGGGGDIVVLPGSGGTSTTVGGNTGTSSGGATNSQQGGALTTATGGKATTSSTGGAQNPSTGGIASTATGGFGVSSGGAVNAGGAPTGGKATGGAVSAGGTATGGAVNAGGAPTGGKATGGAVSAGGKATGGVTTETGGVTTATGGATSTSNEIWISPTGSDTNPGTKASPMFNFCDFTNKTGACYKLCPGGTSCTPGTIWAMTGTYNYKVTQKTTSTFNGTAASNLNLFAEAGATPVFNFTGMAIDDANRGIQIGGNYWHVKGITVTKAGDTGIFVMGNYNTIEQCIAHHNEDAGIVVGVNSSVAGSGSNNLFLNCDSYQNWDTATNGENADGFGAKKSSGGVNNTFRGCRAWDNADDGYDFYGWTESITLENCWAISQCKTTFDSNSDGNGFKLGDETSGSGAAHKLTKCYATDNKYGSSGKGILKNGNPSAITCSGCYSWGNKASDDMTSGVTTTAPGSATAAKMIAAMRNADGSLPDPSTL